MHNFDYHRAVSLDEALNRLGEDEEAIVLSGGQTLIAALKQRLAAPSAIIDISKLASLQGIRHEGGRLVIGAATRHFEVAGSDTVAATIPGLAELAGNIGDPLVRHRGTIGGSVANNDPSADYPAACLALGATMVTDRRSIGAEDFFTGLFETALDAGEILTSIAFPIPQRMAYAKFRNPSSGYAMVGVCAALTVQGARVAVTGSGQDGVFRWADAEAALSPFEPAQLDTVTMDADMLTSDLHANADYRAALVQEMTKRAVATANAISAGGR